MIDMAVTLPQKFVNGEAESSQLLEREVSSFKSYPVQKINGSTMSKLKSWRPVLSEDDRAVLALRSLLFDICNHNGGGHGGSAIGMAAIGVALYKYTMRYNPSNPDWFDRDRFVLSNGE